MQAVWTPAPRLYTRPYAKGPFNAFGAPLGGRVDRICRGKENADDAAMAYWDR
jgi:hypothetical protein